MHELTCQYRFEAARRLPQLPDAHPCSRLHGHSFVVDITVTGPIDPELGWLMDFDELDALAKPLVARLDHAYLNEIDGLGNPTSELIAKWLFERLDAKISGLSRISIAETDRTKFTFMRPS